MKRKLAWIMILLLTALTVTGCGNNGLDDYKKAVEKTELIARGQCSGESTFTFDFNTEGLNQKSINELSYYKNITSKFQATFDHEKKQGIYRNYLNLGGLGFDLDVFQNGDEMYAKLPVIGKYVKLDELKQKADQTAETPSEFLSERTLEALGSEWIHMLNEDDVLKGKDIILTTPDGEVKTTVYTITPKDSQVKAFEEKAVDILFRDEQLKKFYETSILPNFKLQDNMTFEKLAAKMKERIRKDTVSDFRFTAYVDIDGYIVNETLEMMIKRDGAGPGEPESIGFRLEVNKWDINKEQKFEFPELNEENILKTEELGDTMPSAFRDLFKE